MIRHKVCWAKGSRSDEWRASWASIAKRCGGIWIAPAPERIEERRRKRPVWSAVGARLEALLAESPRWTDGKQRLTATGLRAMLVEVGATLMLCRLLAASKSGYYANLSGAGCRCAATTSGDGVGSRGGMSHAAFLRPVRISPLRVCKNYAISNP